MPGALIAAAIWYYVRGQHTPRARAVVARVGQWFTWALLGVVILGLLQAVTEWFTTRAAPALTNSLWFLAYISGCLVAAVVMLFNAATSWFLRWATKTNVILKNLKKLEPQGDSTVTARVAKVGLVFVLEIALSWISALFGIWSLLRTILTTIRETFSSTPESVRALRYPLRNNPGMSRESVWAHVTGLSVLSGQAPGSPDELLTSLDAVADHHSDFDRALALRSLKTLRVVDPELIGQALDTCEQA